MRGHEYIIKMRRDWKKKPSAIFIDDYPVDRRILDEREQGKYPTVCVHGDELYSLNLSFVRGCLVLASSERENRAKELLERLKIFRPARVIASHVVSLGVFPWTDYQAWFCDWREEESND